MGPDEAKALAKEFDFAGEILCLPIANAAGVGPGRMLIVKAPGDEPRVGRGAAEYLREMLPYLSAKQEPAISAVKMISGGRLRKSWMARGSPWCELRKTATRMIADADIQRAAKELVERYGDNAIAAAKERVEAVSTSKDRSEVNVALRVLSAVEVLLADEQS